MSSFDSTSKSSRPLSTGGTTLDAAHRLQPSLAGLLLLSLFQLSPARPPRPPRPPLSPLPLLKSCGGSGSPRPHAPLGSGAPPAFSAPGPPAPPALGGRGSATHKESRSPVRNSYSSSVFSSILLVLPPSSGSSSSASRSFSRRSSLSISTSSAGAEEEEDVRVARSCAGVKLTRSRALYSRSSSAST